ncbi:MAG: hypothetical protein HYY18_21875 [Planctomycetes bacterium]|nr:hypothetical protein [Planctomycetota bacterium]
MQSVLKYGLVLALSAALVTGCDGKKDAGGGPSGGGGGGEAPPPDNTVEVLPDAATAGTITITAKLKGAAPAMAPIDMTDAECAAAHVDTPALDESVVAGSGGTLQNVMVWVDKGLDAKYVFKAPSAPARIDQNGCVYKPHVISMMAKQALEVKNSDGVRHNIHATAKVNAEFNFSQDPKKTDTLTTASKAKTFVVGEVPIKVKCDVHGWMGAWVGVFKHPFHGVTGGDGTVTLKGVPPGSYTLKVWHEKYGTKEVQVTLKDKGAESVTVEFGE